MAHRPARTIAVWLGIPLLIAAAVILFTVEDIAQSTLFQRLELASLDYRFLYRGINRAVHDSSHVVIVEINEESFRSVNAQFPWPRDFYAHLVRNLKKAGARAVGIDLIFDSPDGRSAAGDSAFRAALRETGIVVLAGKREQDADNFERRSAHRDFGNVFIDSDSAVGLVNIRGDADGVFRLYNPYFLMGALGESDRPIPTFAFAVLNRYLGLPPFTAPVDAGSAFRYDGLDIPKYDPASLLVNFYGPNGTFKHIRFHDVIDDETFTTVEEEQTGAETNTFSDPEFGYLSDSTFAGKIVLVGVTVPEYKDLFPVSLGRGRQRGDNQMYGVEIHANVIESVLRNDFLTMQTDATEIPEVIVLVYVTFFLTAWFRTRARKRQALVELGCLAIGSVLFLLIGAAALWAFVGYGIVLSVVSPVAAVVGGYVGSTIYNLVAERRQRVLIKSMFSTYVHPAVVDELLADPTKMTLGGARKELTVLFSDIEGFTSIAQTMEPEALVHFLNEYLDAMSGVILEHVGTLDKYEGDAIMAFWGAPAPQPDHAIRACRSALVMHERLAGLNRRWGAEGRPVFNMRVGINTGEMVVGNMGSSGKFAYTVIGDSVNLASRLEGANKEYRTSIMVSRPTYELVREEIVARELDLITVKGRSEPVGVFELLAAKGTPEAGQWEAFLDVYHRGMEHYHAHRWEEARHAFEAALSLRPDDYPALLHRDRSAQFAAHPSPDQSDVVVLKEK